MDAMIKKLWDENKNQIIAAVWAGFEYFALHNDKIHGIIERLC